MWRVKARDVEDVAEKRSGPFAGCEVQQTHGLLAEEAIGVGRNHVDGTGLLAW